MRRNRNFLYSIIDAFSWTLYEIFFFKKQKQNYLVANMIVIDFAVNNRFLSCIFNSNDSISLSFSHFFLWVIRRPINVCAHTAWKLFYVAHIEWYCIRQGLASRFEFFLLCCVFLLFCIFFFFFRGRWCQL
jgi:hypothetical protein